MIYISVHTVHTSVCFAHSAAQRAVSQQSSGPASQTPVQKQLPTGVSGGEAERTADLPAQLDVTQRHRQQVRPENS